MMIDQTASSQLPADTAPASSTDSESFVPFKDRDFRAASRQTAAKSAPAPQEPSPVTDEVEVAAEVPVEVQSETCVNPVEVAEEQPSPTNADALEADNTPLTDEASQADCTSQADSAVEAADPPQADDVPVAVEPSPAQEPVESVETPVAEELPAEDVVSSPESDHVEMLAMPGDVTAEQEPSSDVSLPQKDEVSQTVELTETEELSKTTETPEPAESVEVTPTVELPAEEAGLSADRDQQASACDDVAAEVVAAEVVDAEVVDAEVVDAEVVDTAVETAESVDAMDDPEEEVVNGFAGLGLNDFVLQAVIDGGYQQPTEIQAEIIPHVLAGQDVLAQSQTGSGKTAAFALPILSRIETGKRASRNPQVLVLAPTRELAIQVSNSFSVYGAALPGFRVATIYGGQSYDAQFRQLKRGVQVVVGTPGRVIDHVKRGTLDLSELGCLVLDEADEMLNMGFLDDVRFVLEHTPDDRQVALFSATLPAPIRAIAEDYLHDPARVTIKRKTMTADSIRQRALFVPARNKMEALKRLLEAEETDGVIIFTKTREATVTVAEQLQQEGLATVALNGDMPQRVRERTIEQLKKGQLDILVATDVAARGLDVARVRHVINYDPPNDSESYIHRVGRTGRAGRNGEAILLLSKSQRGRLRQIERVTRQKIEVIDLPTADDINAARSRRFVQRIAETIAGEDLQLFEKMIDEYVQESGTSMLQVAAALAHLGQQGRPFFVDELPQGRRERQSFDDDRRGNRRFDRDRQDSARGGDDRRPRRRDSESAPVEPGMQRYRIAVGWQDGVKPGNIVGAVANEGGIDGDSIGAIRIYSSWSTIDLPEGIPSDVCETLRTTRVAGRPLQLRPYTDEPDTSRKRPRRFGDDARGKKPFSGRRGGPGGKGGKRPYGKKHGAAGKGGGRPGRDNRRRRQG